MIVSCDGCITFSTTMTTCDDPLGIAHEYVSSFCRPNQALGRLRYIS
jgi:hypothetical protein